MRKLLDIVTIVAGAGFLGLAFLTAYEVLSRKLFNHSLAGVDEIGGYIYAIGAAVGFTAAYVANAHIRINLIVARFPALVRLVLNVLSHAILLAFALLLTWRGGAQWLRSYELGAVSPTPLGTKLVYPQGIWLVALACFTLVIAARLVRALAKIPGEGGITAAARDLDIDDVSAETQAELASLKRRQSPEGL
ncbi:TRAP transporter small permease subunit [Salipiger sp. PrR002]|uniref:TRAP transporter small permease subunit n=1 Tax=Salipiger sp. PrR002 TaxID=2706489 RepID=UPI0013B75D71|nr:TRAP transporter small permease [Salipiger sp. PrR002]NDW01988.1 TRAP transporter small permease [Salipiger sp. PrR002]NDW59028.1 TRAP transporter small permease [Salipiger sp. PrR004]